MVRGLRRRIANGCLSRLSGWRGRVESASGPKDRITQDWDWGLRLSIGSFSSTAGRLVSTGGVREGVGSERIGLRLGFEYAHRNCRTKNRGGDKRSPPRQPLP